MSLTPAHLEALKAYGYTPQEAHFLYLVVTHSGYFLARQFLAFKRAHPGKRPTQFWAKLQARKHARTECFPTYGRVYHVFAGNLYRHLGRENLRSRREHEVEFVERRIAMLDFILAHLEFNYLDTEAEKQAYFEKTCGVSADALPSRTYPGQKGRQPAVRYFVDRFPIFVLDGSPTPVVAFSYLQPAEANLTSFAKHLANYLPLFRELLSFRFLYLARNSSHFDKARELFDSLVTIPLGANPVEDLLRYFAIRKAWDLRQYGSVSEADLLFRNQAKQRFAAARFEHLYSGWSVGRITDGQVRSEFSPDGKSRQVEFAAEVLEAVGTNAPNTGDSLARPGLPQTAGSTPNENQGISERRTKG
jgi:hypothetical protein